MPGRPRSWTDDDLIRAVEESTTISEVLRRLGLSKGGASLATIRRRILELGLDSPTFLQDARSQAWASPPDDGVAQAGVTASWTEEELRWAVATATSMREVLQRLGYTASGSRWSLAKAQITALDLDVSHFGRFARRTAAAHPPRTGDRPRTWSDDDLRMAVADATSVAGVIRLLGLKVGGSVYLMIKERMTALRLDTSHFTGQGWSRGMKVTCNPGRPLDEILVANSTYRSTAALRRRLLKEGLLEPRCARCGIVEWNGEAAPLQLDHINGDRRDHRLENLRLLCPNCHAQTDTWCGKNKGRYRERDEHVPLPQGPLTERVDVHLSNRCAFGREGSSPSGPTIQLTFGDLDRLD